MSNVHETPEYTLETLTDPETPQVEEVEEETEMVIAVEFTDENGEPIHTATFTEAEWANLEMQSEETGVALEKLAFAEAIKEIETEFGLAPGSLQEESDNDIPADSDNIEDAHIVEGEVVDD